MIRSRSKRTALTMTSTLPQTAATIIAVITSPFNNAATTSPALGDVRGMTHDDWLSAQLKLKSYQSSYNDSLDHIILSSWRYIAVHCWLEVQINPSLCCQARQKNGKCTHSIQRWKKVSRYTNWIVSVKANYQCLVAWIPDNCSTGKTVHAFTRHWQFHVLLTIQTIHKTADTYGCYSVTTLSTHIMCSVILASKYTYLY